MNEDLKILKTIVKICHNYLQKGEEIDFWYPDIHAGVLGVKWVEKCAQSGDQGGTWIEF